MRKLSVFVVFLSLLLSSLSIVMAQKDSETTLSPQEIANEELKQEIKAQLKEKTEEIIQETKDKIKLRDEINKVGGIRKTEYFIGNTEKITKIKMEEEVNGDDVLTSLIYTESGKENSIKTKLHAKEFTGENNVSEIAFELSNKEFIKLLILPQEASTIAREKIKMNDLNLSLEEKTHKNIPRVVYHISSEKPGKFLGVFKTKITVSTDIDIESGKLIDEDHGPWWRFLIDIEETQNSEFEEATDTVENNSIE